MPLSHSRRRLLGRSLRISTLLSLALASPLAALADAAYPDKPVKFVVPYPPGGGTDVVARIVQQRLQAALDRIEQPLRQARDRAAAEREQLIRLLRKLLAD